MTNSRSKDKLNWIYRKRANQRTAKEKLRLARGESEVSQELRNRKRI